MVIKNILFSLLVLYLNPFLSSVSFAHSSILHFVNAPDNNIALISLEKDFIPREGMSVLSFRSDPLKPDFSIITGRLKIFKIFENHVYATILDDGTAESLMAYPDYPKIMANDYIKPENKYVVATKQISPIVTLSYFELFKDPSQTSSNYELSEEGQQKLNALAAQFKSKRFKTFLIKSYTDHNGPSDRNQIESYQRALTVKSYLVEHFNFDTDKLIALGLGESDLKDESLAFEYIKNNRRIVFSVVPNL